MWAKGYNVYIEIVVKNCEIEHRAGYYRVTKLKEENFYRFWPPIW